MRPSIPKGTRDFSPQEMVRRNYIFDTIREVFRCYGYLPLETPSMENLSTLMGKYGEEGDKLIFKILNSGNYLDGVDAALLQSADAKKLTSSISEKALRYDLTVPFARYVVMHQNEITFPFKRYQIQPVWRADRPQKGRYREFYQCDADVIGTESLLCEVELIQMFDDVFKSLGLHVTILLNNRKIIQGIAEWLDAPNQMLDIAIAMDKYDKVGKDGVQKELESKGFSVEQISRLFDIIFVQYNKVIYGGLANTGDLNLNKLNFLSQHVQNDIAKKGIHELSEVLKFVNKNLTNSIVQLDLTLARGLNYYTGAIFEVKVNDARSSFTSSICGGGRYDDLTGIFGLKGMSGVGISFGADRIYDVLEEAGLFPEAVNNSTKVVIMNFGEEEVLYALEILLLLRKSGIASELYPDAAKMKKQMSYADARSIPYVILAGSDERSKRVVTLKNMQSGEQTSVAIDGLIAALTSVQ